MEAMMRPGSCDTFVALPPATAKGCVIFGKNSDRPEDEVQEVVYVAAADHADGDKVQCTYIEIPQIAHTYSVMLSKPAWMWGAEMGSNEHGVCIGNEAVWTKEECAKPSDEALLGMDLVRLGLERGKTAKEALDVITGLLEKFGQGGRCFEDPDFKDVTYHNSFIIADSTEAWVLETAALFWAAEKVTSGFRNISNLLTIGTQIDAMSEDLKGQAKSKGYWDGNGDFNFAKAFSDQNDCAINEVYSPQNRYKCGKDLLEKYSTGGKFTVVSMMDILRDEKSGICRVGGVTGIASTASQVSVLYPVSSGTKSCHWFTATPNPACSVFKPFIFCTDPATGNLTTSPDYGDKDPARTKPRFQKQVDRMHPLYKAHKCLNPLPGDGFRQDILTILKGIEAQCIGDMDEFLANFDESKEPELRDLYKDGVETEIKFYNVK